MPDLPLAGTFSWLAALFSPHDQPGWFWLAIGIATLLFVGVMLALHQLSPAAKKWMTIVCTFLAGLYFALEFFWPTTYDAALDKRVNFITPTLEPVTNFIAIMSAWTIGLGIISLAMVHGKRLIRRASGWHHSLAFFLALIAMLVFGFWTKAGGSETAGAAAHAVYTTLFRGVMINLEATMFALLAFYIASAAYRAFRVRTAEAAVLMLAAFVVMLGFVNFGVAITAGIPKDSWWAFFRLENLSFWTLGWLNMPAYRAVTLGVEVGALAMAMRIWLSLERGAFFSQEK
ncbi:MAG TPA: hypothetical protein PLZ36_13345 [Armatimonadota bacterium]|nr:hypothetical protein [Armatimonadota bacterium]